MAAKKKYTTRDLDLGTKLEMEHKGTIKKFTRKGVRIKSVARSIAKDHLEEHPRYYKELKKMEKKLKGSSK